MWARIERFFLARYDSERLITRKRNRGLLAILLAVIPISLALSILMPIPTLQIGLAAMGAVAIALALMLKAGFALQANVAATFLLSALLAAMCFLQPFREGSEIYSIAAYETMLITIAGFIAHRKFQMIGILVIGAAGVLLDYFLRIVPGGMGADNLNNVVICLILLATSAFAGRGIMRRGDMLLGMAEAEAEKNEGQVRALQSVIRSSEDALGMGTAVRESSERTRGRIARLKELSASAVKSLDAFAQTTALISESNSEVAAAADSVHERISDQSSIVTQSSSAIEEMTASVTSIERIAAARLQSMDQLKEATAAGTGEMEKASESVRAMAESIASIGEIVKVIRKVASQTNLLAMNAAIEAAHAGDSGAGFSVVAGEIRKLSEETDRQVKLIDGSIKETIASVRTAESITEGARRTFDRVSAEAATMVKAMNEIGDGLGQIAAGSGEILAGVTESVAISNNVKDAAGTVDERIAAASRNLEVLATAGTAVRSAMADFSALLDELLAEAEIMASSGLASESGLRVLAQALEGFDRGESIPEVPGGA